MSGLLSENDKVAGYKYQVLFDKVAGYKYQVLFGVDL